uniref:subtilisin n=1 Tax=Globisporangium ultimum (strain ATCC 200006 / CBS 805.95 / DAOM BR144) TaxID=431595 RepID=K3WRQ3_GLOUD
MNVRFATFLAAVAVAVAASTASALPTVHPGVHRALRKDGTVDLVIELAQTTESTLESIQEAAFSSRTAKIEAIKDKLQAQSKVASAEVEKVLSQESSGLHGGFKNFWISNQITVNSASFELVAKLAGLSSVGTIREQEMIYIEEPQAANDANNELVGQEWGIQRIGANKVWADGNIGQGVIVANIDTGVRFTHEALKRNFIGKNGWYDPELESAEPYDIQGHGSHTMGTIAGSHGVGVAPGATWLACKGCRWYETEEGPKVGCAEEDLFACAQFMLCPTDTKGANPDCSKAPRVINNSWGGAGGRPYFKGAVDAWVKAGIVPVFSQGNSGRDGCRTAGSPGDYPNVIGVGSTTSTDALSDYSSKGPTVGTSRRKPDISAPGQTIRSVWNSTDSIYRTISGTSMAAPHVTGAVALLLAAQPDLAIDEVKVALYTTTDQKGLAPTNYTCGATSDQAWPNNQFGHGRLNVFNAYEGFRPAP